MGNKSKGTYCSNTRLCLLVLLVVIAIVAAVLLTYFLHPDRNNAASSSASPAASSKGSTPGKPSTPTTPTTTEKPPPPNVRLSEHLAPKSYTLKLRPDIYGGDPTKFTFTGAVTVRFLAIKATKTITLHIKKLEINEGNARVQSARDNETISISDIEYEATPKEFIHINLDTELTAAEEYTAYLEFSGNITDDLVGIYYSTYTDDSGDVQYLLASQLQVTDARKVFPCFDEPALKAKFTTSIERKSDYKSTSNTDIISSENVSDGWIVDHFWETPIMSTYLLAFIVSKFECKMAPTKTGTKVEVCARPNAINQTDFALEVAVLAQEYLEEYHDIPYPLPKMTHVALPDMFAGAMENWGLITYRESNLLYDPQTTPLNAKQYITIVVAHEISHMWFGDLVSPAWWDDVWLNEGFATWMSHLSRSRIEMFADWQVEQEFVVSEMQYVMRLDGLASSHPIYQPVNLPDELYAIFDAITYYKAASVIRMVKYFVGDDVFRWGLSNYLKGLAYSGAHHDDLFNALTKEAEKNGNFDVNVTAVTYTWIRQMGYPVVHVSFNNVTGDVTLRQKHFLLDKSKADQVPASPYNYIWKIPVTILPSSGFDDVSDQKSDIHWFHDQEEMIKNVVPEDSEWVIANIRQEFYYRVNYDLENWEAIIDQLNSDHMKISYVENRAQLVDDAFALGRAGDLDQLVGLRTMDYMDKEEEYVPWYSATTNLDYLDLMFKLTPGYSNFKTFVQNKMAPHHDRLGWTQNSDQPIPIQKMRTLIIGSACYYGLASCVQKSTDTFNSWMENPGLNRVTADLQSTVFCAGVKYGGNKEWDFIYERYQTSESAAERGTFLQALACTRNTDLLSSYMQRALEGEIRYQDFHTVLGYVASNPGGRALAWTFMRSNWHQILETMPVFNVGKMVAAVTESFSTEWDKVELDAFVNSLDDLGTALNVFQQALEKVKINIGWKAANEKKIFEWLKTKTI